MKRAHFSIPALLLIVIALSPTPSAAKAGGINAQEAHQSARIQAGLADGSLTPREGHRLESQQARSEALEQRMRADGGGLGPFERARYKRVLRHDSRSIYRQRHDAQVR
jgi:hypothetical protein